MNELFTLGERVRSAWEARHFDAEAFDAVATHALEQAGVDAAFDIGEFGDWLAHSPFPPQHTIDESFGQPSITIYHHEHFRVDVLFWHTATTGIHEHGFSGAFTVLHGSSLHAAYSFAEREEITPALAVGDVRFERLEVLRKGAVRTIPAGPRLIHSLFHLDSPSVSLVIRTQQTLREREYKPPSIAIDPSERPAAHVKRLQFLGMLARTGSADYARFASTLVRSDDPLLSFRALLQVRFESAETFEQLCRRTTDLFPKYADVFRHVAEEEGWRLTMMSLRRSVVDPELRLFLALLVNLRTREAIDAAVRNLLPGRLPADVLFGWTKRLAAATDIGITFDDTLASVVQMLLQRVPDEAIAPRLLSQDECDGESVAMMLELTSRIRALPMLTALFR